MVGGVVDCWRLRVTLMESTFRACSVKKVEQDMDGLVRAIRVTLNNRVPRSSRRLVTGQPVGSTSSVRLDAKA